MVLMRAGLSSSLPGELGRGLAPSHLQALLIDFDRALIEVEEARRLAFNQVFADAGLGWQCDPESYIASVGSACTLERFGYFVRSRLGGRCAPEDAEKLVVAMHRRKMTILAESLELGRVDLRPGIRELVVAALLRGVRVALITNLGKGVAERMLASEFGARTVERITVIDEGAMPAGANGYRSAIDHLGTPLADCLIVAGTASSVARAAEVGVPCIHVRSSYDVATTASPVLFAIDNLERLKAMAGGGTVLEALEDLHSNPSPSSGSAKRSDVMRVADILRSKGSSVKTVPPEATAQEFAQKLRVEGVGAMVVKGDNAGYVGIISERDLAHGLAVHGAHLPKIPVTELMTKSVITCGPDDSISEISKVMTTRRIRHVPVVEGGKLVGLVSIGDVLKYRLDEIQLEANVLREYAMARR